MAWTTGLLLIQSKQIKILLQFYLNLNAILEKKNFLRKEAPPRDEMVYNIKEKPFKAALRKGKYKLLWGSLSQKVLFVFLYSFTSLKTKVKIVYKGKALTNSKMPKCPRAIWHLFL